MADQNKRDGVDSQIGFVSVEVFSHQTACSTVKHMPGDCCASVYLGETLKYDVVIKRHPSVDAGAWQKRIIRITCRATILRYEDLPDCISASQKKTNRSTNVIILEANESLESANGLLCPILATFVGSFNISSSNDKNCSWQPYFRDVDTYVIPMSLHLQDMWGDCQFVQLQIVLCLHTVNITRSDTSPDSESNLISECTISGDKNFEREPLKKIVSVDIHGLFCDDDDGDEVTGNGGHLNFDLSPVKVTSSHCVVQEKTVTVGLQVQGPPELRMRHSPAGQKQLILVAVNNKTQKQMVIKSIQMLSNSSPVHDSCLVKDEGSSIKWEICHQVINLECPKRSHAFPVILSSWEELNLIYRLHLSSVPTDSELSLRANIKWTHAGASNEITSVYRIPRIKVRCPPFVVTARCDEETELSRTFFVTYTISNQLHDFTSMRLYYNLDNMCRTLAEHGGTEEEINRVQQFKNSVVCLDPDTAINSCPRGSCVPVRVGFHIHRPGLYELSQLMKVNLRYSLLDTQLSPVPDDRESRSTCSDNSASFQSSDEHLLASEELWRGRSGSTASLAMPLIFQSAEEKRRSFASKSYSFGDLGPTMSADSDDAGCGRKNKFVKRSSAVLPPRPPPPRMLSQSEQELIKPSNFLKQPFYIYISDPVIM